MRSILFLTVLFLSSWSYAAPNDTFRKGIEPQPVFGIVQGSSLNTLEVYDEQQKQRRQFVYLGHTVFEPGDRVRIEYGKGRVIKTIIKMSRPIYEEQTGTNGGYILKAK